MPLPPLKKYDLPEIDPEYMTPQVKVLVDFVKEILPKRDALYAEVVAKQKELEQLRRAKKRAQRRAK